MLTTPIKMTMKALLNKPIFRAFSLTGGTNALLACFLLILPGLSLAGEAGDLDPGSYRRQGHAHL